MTTVFHLHDDQIEKLQFDKNTGLLPAIIQDATTACVLMQGYMNREALAATLNSGLVTFFSRSKNRLWQKGETSGHTLLVEAIFPDCDFDSLLILTKPQGPTCHRGTKSCFDAPTSDWAFLQQLISLIAARITADPKTSYTAQLLQGEIRRIAQKVGEEGVEVALAGVSQSNEAVALEAADLLFHLLVLLQARQISFGEVMKVLRARHTPAAGKLF